MGIDPGTYRVASNICDGQGYPLPALTYPPLAYTYGVLLFLRVTGTPRGLLARLAFLGVFG